MMIDENIFARFVLTSDFSGESVLANDEFYDLESNFYNKDLSDLETMPLWKIVDIVNDTKLAEKIYSAFQNTDKNAFEKLSQNNILTLTNIDSFYPKRLAQKLKNDAPVLLYTLGNIELLNKPSVAVIGSRKIDEKGKKFAFDIGESIAKDGKILVSGGAKGSDYFATKSAIQNGGKAVWFVAVCYDEIMQQREVKQWIEDEKLLICWAFNPFSPFKSKNALKRNRYIYANAESAFVCQVNSKISGTYSGANFCLKNNLCELFVFDNDSDTAKTLIQNGAIAIYEK